MIFLFSSDDPVKMFDFQASQQNSVMKFVTDLYREKPTSSLLYTNDAKVLVDIIIRQLTDLQPGDEVLYKGGSRPPPLLKCKIDKK